MLIQNKEEEEHGIDKTYCTQALVLSLPFGETSWILH